VRATRVRGDRERGIWLAPSSKRLTASTSDDPGLCRVSLARRGRTRALGFSTQIVPRAQIVDKLTDRDCILTVCVKRAL